MTGMAKRLRTSAWAKALTRSFAAITRSQLRAGTRVARQAVKRAASTATATARAKARAPAGAGDWIAGVSVGSAGARRSVQRGKRYPKAVTDFKQRGSTVATLVEVAGLGHAWSGGAASQPFSDGHGPDASRMVWAFAAKQFGGR